MCETGACTLPNPVGVEGGALNKATLACSSSAAMVGTVHHSMLFHSPGMEGLPVFSSASGLTTGQPETSVTACGSSSRVTPSPRVTQVTLPFIPSGILGLATVLLKLQQHIVNKSKLRRTTCSQHHGG